MEKHFKTIFNSSQNTFGKVKFTKSSNNFNTKMDTNYGKPEDIYYDEVVIYDGGGVEGYGYEDKTR
jgi:hypothetical protein